MLGVFVRISEEPAIVSRRRERWCFMVEGIANAVMQSKQVEFLLNVQTRLMKKQMDLQKEMMNELLQSLGVGNNLNVVG